MKLDVQTELQRIKVWQACAPPLVDPDLLQLLGVIAGYLEQLTTTDWQVAKALRERGTLLATELQRLMSQLSPAQAAEQTLAKRDKVLYAIYDRVESLLIVARANQNWPEIDIYQQLFDYIQKFFTQELEWARIESLGHTYNPDRYDGFVVKRLGTNETEDLPGLKIVNELRAGFTCRGAVVRKPVVEFLE